MKLNRRDLIKSFIGALGISLAPKYIEHKSQIDELFTLSLKKYRKEMVDIVFQQNLLFFKLIEDSSINYTGGDSITTPLMYDGHDA